MPKTKFIITALIIFSSFLIPKLALASVDLSDWEQQGGLTNGNWQISGNNNEKVLQTINGNPTFFVSPNNFINGTINGTFKVKTGDLDEDEIFWGDNDWIGFVFGYQKPISANNEDLNDYDFYLFDWKKEEAEGYTLNRVNGITNPLSSNYYKYFWDHFDAGPDGVFDVLQTKYGDYGWEYDIKYYFKLVYESDRIQIFVSPDETIDASDLIFNQSGIFQPGRFGFYNYSQENVEYGDFTSSGEPPVANNDEYVLDKITSLITTTGYGILSNDESSTLGNLTAVLQTSVSNGTLNLNSDSTFTYTPNADYAGTDSFTYKAYDGTNYSNIGTVNFTVTPPPLTLTVTATYNADGQITVTWTDSNYTNFTIERRTDAGSGFGSYVQVGTANKTTFIDNVTNNPTDPPQKDERYQYRLIVNDNGNEYIEDPNYVYTTPVAPTMKTPLVDSSTAITWHWTDNSAFEELFKLKFNTSTSVDVDVDTNLSESIDNVNLSINPTHAGSITHGTGGALLDHPLSVYVLGNYAYVASTLSNALEIIDVSDPANPTHAGSITHGTGGALLNVPVSVYVSGNYAYVVSTVSDSLEIIDISDPANPTHAGSITHGTGGAFLDVPASIYVSGNYAYVVSMNSNSLEVIDISDPANPTHAGSITHGTGGALLNVPVSIHVSGNYAYISARDSNALEVIDISNPANPTHAGSITHGTGGALLDFPSSVYVSGNYAYVASINSNALEIIDISDPANPTHVKSIVNSDISGEYFYPTSVYISDNYAYVVNNYSLLEIIDISDPVNPIHVGSIKNGIDGTSLKPWYVHVTTNYAYVVSSNNKALEIINVNLISNDNIPQDMSHQTINLTPNTQYGVDIDAYRTDRGSSKPTTNSSLVYTLANVPINLNSSQTEKDNITLLWGANSNPSYTKYYITNITDNVNYNWAISTTFKATGLVCNKEFTFKVKARNEDGIETVFSEEKTIKTASCEEEVDIIDPVLTPDISTTTDPIITVTPIVGVDPTLLINNDDATTKKRNVVLNLTADEDTKTMEISSDPNFDKASIVPFQKTLDFDLCQGSDECKEGTYTIYAKFYGEDEVPSQIVSDSIIYKPEIKEVLPVTPKCDIEKDKVTYDLYIVNPDGQERHMNTKYTVIDDLGDNVFVINFEDKGTDFDHDDLRIKVDRSDLENIIITAVDFDASWHHQIKIKFFYKGSETDILLWKDSHLVAGKSAKYNSKLINLCDYSSLFEKKSFSFIKNLSVNTTDLEVKILQKFLNNHGFQIAKKGAGSPGNEVEYFGYATKKALAQFQNKYKDKVLTPFGLTMGTGYFGPGTRNYINSLKVYSDGTAEVQPSTGDLNGLILLQVEANGEAWYVYPNDSKRYYLGRPADAFRVMRELGLGVNHAFIAGNTIYPDRVAGKILIDVEDHGKAYYIYPKNKKAYYLGKPADAFQVMRELGLGISNNNLKKINTG